MEKRIKREDISSLISLAIEEDIGGGDITSEAVFSRDDRSCSSVIAKDEGVFCGGDVALYVYEMIDMNVRVKQVKRDGDMVSRGDPVLQIEGPTRAVLAGERLVLNFLQRLSGIATATKRMVNLLEGSAIKVLDTRKTAPGFRLLDKYAVQTGGGKNHRFGLYDMVMIKDNHIKAAGGIGQAVKRVREKYGDEFKIEVETVTLKEVREALVSKVDIIMLDNMNTGLIKEALSEINGQCGVEVSGNIDETRLFELRQFPVDYISMGALTHSVKAFDLSMKFE